MLHTTAGFGKLVQQPHHQKLNWKITTTTSPLTANSRSRLPIMNGEDPQERPDYITSIINGLERYNPEAVGTLEGYVQQQCEQRFCDCNANRTLLKL